MDYTKDSLENENTLSLEDIAILSQRSSVDNDSKFELVHSKAVSQAQSTERSLESQGYSCSDIQHIYDGVSYTPVLISPRNRGWNCQKSHYDTLLPSQYPGNFLFS